MAFDRAVRDLSLPKPVRGAIMARTAGARGLFYSTAPGGGDQVRRRQFIGVIGGAVSWALTARAQQQKQRLIGVLMATSEDDPDSRDRFNAFRQALSEADWAEGRTLRIESRWISGDPERARSYAAELVDLENGGDAQGRRS